LDADWTAGGTGLAVSKVLSGKLALALLVGAFVVELIGLFIGVAWEFDASRGASDVPMLSSSRELDQA
jgi:hypothetical protein